MTHGNPPQSADDPRRVAYLVSAYPAVSHTFIAREIDALRGRGIGVETFTIRRTPDDQLLSEADRVDAAEVFAVLPVRPWRLAWAHLSAIASRPSGYRRTLTRSLGMGTGSPRARLWQLFYFVEAIVVWDELRRRGIRHVHAHFANVACAVAMLAADFGAPDGLSWSFTMHGSTEFENVTAFALAEKVQAAAFVACISDFCRSQLMKLVDPEHWQKLAIVRCGLPVVHGPAPTPLDDERFRILCVGRLVPEKGQLILLRAVAHLREQGIRAHVVFVGDGPDAERLRRSIDALGLTEHAEMLGALGSGRVSELHRQTDVFCLPSFAEGIPVVLMEAMSVERPVVATSIAGIPELIRDGVSGALVPPGRPEPLTAALARLASDPELGRRWGRAGREQVERRYDIARAAELLDDLFRGARPTVG